jgi:hypothetical protein
VQTWYFDFSVFEDLSLAGAQEDEELVHAQVFFRHGARAPFSDCSDMPKVWNMDLRADTNSAPEIKLVDLSTNEPAPDAIAKESFTARNATCMLHI